MEMIKLRGKSTFCCWLTAVLAVALPLAAWAHCDTESGPVAVDARQALEDDDFRAVAIWVGEKQNDELRSAFGQTLPVYQMGGKAAELAEQYFTETAVRLHRQAEGLPYTGLKPAQPLPPDVAAAERTLETGDPAEVLELLETELKKKLTVLFDDARAAQKDKDKSLENGREWADAYVKYVIYVHGLYKTINAGPEHGVGE